MKIIEFIRKSINVITNGAKGIDATSGKVFQKLMIIAIPIMLTSVLHNLYEIFDAFWLGRYPLETAIASVQVSRPIIWLLMSLGMGLGMGGSTLVSQAKGAKNEDEVGKYAGHTIFILLIFSIFVSIVALLLPKQMLSALGTPPEVMKGAIPYLQIVLGPAPLLFYTIGFIIILNGIGNVFITFIFTAITVFLNAVLDPFLIFGIGPFPEMGVSGAAIATTISRSLVAIFGTIYIFKGKAGITLKLPDFRPTKERILKILKIGIPNSLGNGGAAFGFVILQFLINGVTNEFYNGEPTVINAFGIMHVIVGMTFMVTMGLGQATGIVVGQNIGANKIKRVEKSVRNALYLAFVLLVIGFMFMFFAGGEFSKLFIPPDKDYSFATQEIVTSILKIIAPGVVAFGLLGIIFGAFQGAGYTLPIMIMNITRLWVLRLPFALILAFGFNFWFINIKAMGLDGICWGMCISNIVAFIPGFLLYLSGKWKKKSLVKKIPENIFPLVETDSNSDGIVKPGIKPEIEFD